MKKHKRGKLVIFILIESISIIIFIMLMNSAQATKEEAKSKLEDVINKSYSQDNKVDIGKLKDNIETNINTAKVVNRQATQFPIQTVIDGFEFTVDENGNIDDENKEELPNDEKIGSSEPEESYKKTTIVKYKNDVKTDKGITISTTEDGVVTINGKSTEKLFIKISNNIQISDTVADFENWKQEDGIIIEKGKKIKQKVTMLSDIPPKGQVNVVLRTEKNEATGILKLIENQTEYIGILPENIIANYIYIDKGVEIDNMQFSVEITEENINNEPNKIIEDYKSDKGIECRIDQNGIISLNGTTTDKLFIKLTNGIDITSDGNKNTEVAMVEPIMFKNNEKINIKIDKISGNLITDNKDEQFNLVLKYKNGDIATILDIKNDVFIGNLQCEEDISMVYLFISQGVTLEDYKMQINFNNEE